MTLRQIFLVVACLALAGWNGRALGQPAPGDGKAQKSPDQKFEELLTQAQKDPARADWKALRIAFAATSHYHPYNGEWHKELTNVRKEIEKGALKDAEALLVKLLERERFMRLDGHGVAIALYEKMGESDKSRKHRAVLEGLWRALFVPGTGRTLEKPIEVLFIDEEYLLLVSLGLKAKQQGLLERNGHRFDVLTTEAKGDQPELDFYFNVDLPWGALRKSFEEALDSAKKPAAK